MNCLARYESLTSPDLPHDKAVTLLSSLSPTYVPRLLKIDETPVDIVEIFI